LGVLARLANTVYMMTARLDELAERGLRGWVEEYAASTHYRFRPRPS
jgi:hypothetical protein